MRESSFEIAESNLPFPKTLLNLQKDLFWALTDQDFLENFKTTTNFYIKKKQKDLAGFKVF